MAFHACRFEYLSDNLLPVLRQVFQVALALAKRGVPFQGETILAEAIGNWADTAVPVFALRTSRYQPEPFFTTRSFDNIDTSPMARPVASIVFVRTIGSGSARCTPYTLSQSSRFLNRE
jgi:hypothetical protein